MGVNKDMKIMNSRAKNAMIYVIIVIMKYAYIAK